MKQFKFKFNLVLTVAFAMSLVNCTFEDKPISTDLDSSTEQLLVKKFKTAPLFDGEIDEVWSSARPLLSSARVSSAGDRVITLNGSSNGNTALEPTDLFDPYTGESYNYSLRGGYYGEYLYLLFEWEDEADSQDRQSFYFDPATSTWKQQNKYANNKDDKFYEDKFAMMFPIKVNGEYPEGFKDGSCTVTCHGGLTDPASGDKVTRHYMKNAGELTDLWHWKRDRHALAEACDDGYVQWEDDFGKASANGRKNDEGISPYSTSMKFTDGDTGMSGPKYVIPARENYYWITQAEIDGGTAKAITAIAVDGTLTYAGGTIDPNGDSSYSEGSGNKRMPSIIINPGGQGADPRSEVQIKSKHTGAGWQLEIRRKLNTGDPTDADFTPGQSIPFGLSIFNNAAIGHAMSNYKTMKIE